MRLLLTAAIDPRGAAEELLVRPRWLLRFVVLSAAGIAIMVVNHPHAVESTLARLPLSVTAQDKLALRQMLDEELGVRCCFQPVRLLIGW